jgi:autotransporter-associated beta strand protein
MKSAVCLPLVASSALILAASPLVAAPIVREANSDNLNLGSAWVGTTPPGTADTATWNAASTLANTLGGNPTWGALDTGAASGAVSIGGANTLTLDHATAADTVFAAGANNFTFGAAAIGGTFNIIGATPNTSTAQGATFSGSGSVTLSSTGTKNWSSQSSSNGVTEIAFTGTLALRGAAIPALGSLSGNWLALGGGGGDLGNPGAVTQTGAFALDLGDAASCGSFILTHGFNSKVLSLKRLSGTGSIRADWGIGGPTSNRGIELDQADDTTLTGSILAHNGSGQRRNINFTKKGAGKLTLAGALGTSGGLASLNFDLQGGVIQLGDSGATPVFVGTMDAASTFAVAAGAELRFMRTGAFSWPYVHGGAGTIRLAEPAGAIAFTGASPAFAGSVAIDAGSLRPGPDLGTAAMSVAAGATLAAGLPATNGLSKIGSVALADGSASAFRLGAASDRIEVGTPDGLTAPPAGGTHTINLSGSLSASGTITLIDYAGTAISPDEFSRFVLGSLPPGTATYELVDNSANTSIDLLVTFEDQIWKGAFDNNWDATTENWELAGTPGTTAVFSLTNPALFNDTAIHYTVQIDAGGVAPLGTTFDNSLNDYTLAGGAIGGSGKLTKKGGGTVVLAQANSYSGGTAVEAGKLQIGAGGASGDLGAGAVAVAAGATLEFNRANATPGTPDLDYKASAKLRTVSGAGDIVLTGSVHLFNYTGGGTGFAEANSWAGFSGNLVVKGGSEFMTIRNGATAMGTGNIILGDESGSGILSQIEGNWTWTNNIVLAGSANVIRNRSAGAPRALKLQGVLSGSGGLAFEDATGAMNDPNRGFILTGANTFEGTLTIAAGVPLRVGGLPGNVDATNPGQAPGAAGSLGSASVVNNGSLTFARTDAHTVANSISGTGALRVGIPAAAGLGDSSSQILTYTGTATHGGPTTILNGTLILGPAASLGGSTASVEAGATLAGSGTLAAPLVVAGTIAPGSGLGTLAVLGDTAVTGTLAVEIDGAAADLLTVTGNLDFTGSSLAITESGAGFTAESYVIAECFGGTITGLPLAPAGYQVEAAGSQVVLRKAAADDFTTWINAFTFAPGADLGPAGDPDGDGLTNFVEYAFGLKPNDPSSLQPILAQLDIATGTFTYSRRDDALTGLGFTVWTSPDLENWTPDDAANQDDSAGPDGDGVEVVVVTLTAAKPLTADRLFVKVTAE